MDKERAIANFNKTAEIIETCFELKTAYIKSKHPELSDFEVQNLVSKGIVERKMRAWEMQKD